MSYYRYHVFFCTNLRPDGSQCCQQCGAQEARDYVKQRVKQLGSAIPDKVRINSAGCLDRCAEGPVLVVYPAERVSVALLSNLGGTPEDILTPARRIAEGFMD